MASNKRRVAALVIDGSADISLGIIATAVASYFFAEDLTWWALCIGIGGAFAPDVDALYFYATKGFRNTENLYTHRSGVHYPLLYLPFVSLLIGFLSYATYPSGGVLITATFVGASFLHFVHDTFLHGWGIPWWYPFGKSRITLFCHTRPGRPVPKVFVFPIAQLRSLREEHRDPNWYEIFYRFPPHPWTYVMIVIHALGLFVLFV